MNKSINYRPNWKSTYQSLYNNSFNNSPQTSPPNKHCLLSKTNQRSSSIRKKLDSLMSRCQARETKNLHKYSKTPSYSRRMSITRSVGNQEMGVQTKKQKIKDVGCQTESEKYLENKDDFQNDIDFVQFLKSVSLYCTQNEDLLENEDENIRGYKRLHKNLEFLKETYRKYKEITKSKQLSEESSENLERESYRKSSPKYENVSYRSDIEDSENNMNINNNSSIKEIKPEEIYSDYYKSSEKSYKNKTLEGTASVDFINEMYNKLFS